MYCWPARDTCSVQRLPSQYRSSKRPEGSGYQPAGTASLAAGAGAGAGAAAATGAGSAAGAAAVSATGTVSLVAGAAAAMGSAAGLAATAAVAATAVVPSAEPPAVAGRDRYATMLDPAGTIWTTDQPSAAWAFKASVKVAASYDETLTEVYSCMPEP